MLNGLVVIVLPASTCPTCHALALSLSLSASRYLRMLSVSYFPLWLQAATPPATLHVVVLVVSHSGQKNHQCFAICAFPVSVAVARSQTRSSSPSLPALFPLTDTFFICSKYPVMHRMLLMLRCTVVVAAAVSSTEPGHAWELLTKQTAEQGQHAPQR